MKWLYKNQWCFSTFPILSSSSRHLFSQMFFLSSAFSFLSFQPPFVCTFLILTCLPLHSFSLAHLTFTFTNFRPFTYQHIWGLPILCLWPCPSSSISFFPPFSPLSSLNIFIHHSTVFASLAYPPFLPSGPCLPSEVLCHLLKYSLLLLFLAIPPSHLHYLPSILHALYLPASTPPPPIEVSFVSATTVDFFDSSSSSIQRSISLSLYVFSSVSQLLCCFFKTSPFRVSCLLLLHPYPISLLIHLLHPSLQSILLQSHLTPFDCISLFFFTPFLVSSALTFSALQPSLFSLFTALLLSIPQYFWPPPPHQADLASSLCLTLFLALTSLFDPLSLLSHLISPSPLPSFLPPLSSPSHNHSLIYPSLLPCLHPFLLYFSHLIFPPPLLLFSFLFLSLANSTFPVLPLTSPTCSFIFFVLHFPSFPFFLHPSTSHSFILHPFLSPATWPFSSLHYLHLSPTSFFIL